MRWLGLVVAAVVWAQGARADDDFDYQTRRLEPAGFPILGGSSDTGVELGAVGTLTRLGDGVRPYIWNMDALVAVSAKNGPSGSPEITQQAYLWTIDAPEVFGSKLRTTPAISYTNTINSGYFGLGNASSADRPAAVAGNRGRYFQYRDRVAMARNLLRIPIWGPFDAMIAAQYRYESPLAYAGSKLAEDAAAGRVRGLAPMSLVMGATGLVYDTRDNEYFPRRGAYHQVGVRYVQGLPLGDDVRYGAFGAIFAMYRELGGPFVLALRAVVDAQAGHVPFYDLFTGEPFTQDQIIGGSAGVRGVPEGRYLGKSKALGNAELRGMFVDFHLLGQAFHLGGDVFFDTGRTWESYAFTSAIDGHSVGLKWGAGGGVYLRWGQAAVFRVEAAYSPDATAVNPGFPIGLYVQDGVMF